MLNPQAGLWDLWVFQVALVEFRGPSTKLVPCRKLCTGWIKAKRPSVISTDVPTEALGAWLHAGRNPSKSLVKNPPI